MLIVRRAEGQSIVIAGEVEIQILEIASNKVKLGILGPKAISVARKEVLLTIENNLAAQTITAATQTAIADKLARFPRINRALTDKTCEQDTSGIPEAGRT